MRRGIHILACAVLVLGLSGCINTVFVNAVDRHTSVILPEYRAYVQADPVLGETSKRIRLESADTLEALIREAKQATLP